MPTPGIHLCAYRWLILCTCVGTCHPAPDHRGGASTWRDPSPHASQMVSIAPGVSVEVLDWGGHGQPLVFLAGLGDTPHVYDDFAPTSPTAFTSSASLVAGSVIPPGCRTPPSRLWWKTFALCWILSASRG
jgi:hypothetical protein